MTDNVENVNSNVETNKKILKWVGIVVAAIIVLSIIGGSGSSKKDNPSGNYTPTTEMYQSGPNWSDWKNGFSPVWQKFYSDYTTTLSDLSNGDAYAARQDFAELSHDAAEISTWSSSPDATVNSWVDSLANDLNSLAYEGVQSLNSIDNGGDVSPGFSTSAQDVKDDIDGLSTALSATNNSIQ